MILFRTMLFCSLTSLASAPALADERMSFTDVTLASGFEFEHTTTTDHQSGPMHGGGAVGDFNGDGYPDVFVLGGGQRPDALFINQRDGTFRDEAKSWGVALRHRGVGATTGDIDHDGDDDLFVTSYGDFSSFARPGEHLLYRNEGGRFVNVAEAAGVATTTTTHPDGYGAAFGDIDRDGDLDLFVGAWHNAAVLGAKLFVNKGDGTFRNTTERASVITESTRAFGAIFSDMDGDGWPEMLVSGDFGTSRYYRNLRNGTFAELDPGTGQGAVEGTPDWSIGRAHNAMGMAVADFDRNNRPDWFITAIWPTAAFENDFWGNGLYLNQGAHLFQEQSAAAGVNDGGWGWGSEAADFDHDGWVDLIMTNGWPITDVLTGESFDGETAYLWRNSQDGTFDDVTDAAGFDHQLEGRALMTLDYDRDGDLDVLILSHQQPARLYRNDLSADDAHWLALEFDMDGRTDLAPHGLGARVHIDGPTGRRTLVPISGASYISQSSRVMHIGLGDQESVPTLRIEWGGGQATVLRDVAADQYLAIQPPAKAPRPRPIRPALPGPARLKRD
ncbi:MAG: CRTAC1 family protein [Pseudomonadota bacterium]